MRFIDNKDGTITDTETGLMWQQETLSTMSYDNAVLTCSELDLAGYKDWKLPTIKELQSIVDFERNSPACDPMFRSQSGYYWSSSTGQLFPTTAWGVFFDVGGTFAFTKTAGYYVRAVRAGSCPRPTRQPVPKTDTTQLKALRDATIAYYGAKMSSDLVAICDRAIASLEAAEQPKNIVASPGKLLVIFGDGHVEVVPVTEQVQQPAPADVPPMPHSFHPFPAHPLAVCEITDVESLHAACVRIAAELAEARRELEAVKEDKRCALDLLAQERSRADKAEAELAALKGQDPQTPLQLAAEACRAVGMLEGHSDQIAESVRILAVRMKDYADTHIPLAQHEAALAQARRDGLREALALVERDRMGAAVHSTDDAWSALNLAAVGIRALAEKGGDVLIGKTDCTECDVSFPCYGGKTPCIRD